MRALILLLSPLAYLFQTSQIEVRELETTPTQAVLVFQVPDPDNCTVKVARDEAFAQLVHDSNTALFSGAQNCNRPGSFVDGNTVTFVSGLRRAQKAADQKFYSRALEANQVFYYRIQSGAQTKEGSFSTKNPPLGKTYGEPYPYEAEAPGHYAWPTVDWTDAAKEYVDPLTGILMKRMTSPGQNSAAVTSFQAGLAAFDTGSGAWSNASSGAAMDNATATYSGSGRTPLFVRGPEVCPGIYNCGRGPRWDDPFRGVDDIQVSIKAWCSSSGCLSNAAGERNVEVCVTVDGVSCATAWKTVTTGTGSGSAAVQYPGSFPAPLFANWLGGDRWTPPARPDVVTLSGKVNTNGTVVSWASGDTFNVGAWNPGSRITIAGTEYVIESVDGATQLTLTSEAGILTAADYRANNFGVLIRKATTSADLVQVDGVSFRIADSAEFEMEASANRDMCAPEKVDSSGKEGYVCLLLSRENVPTLWFIAPSDGEARYLGAPSVPYNFDVSGGAIDGNHTSCPGLVLNPANPNQMYCVTTSNTSPSQGTVVFRATYHPEGVPGCNQPADYQAIAGTNCHITWEYMTKPSQGGTVTQKAEAFDNTFQAQRYPYIRMIGITGNLLGLYAWAGQDTMAWSMWLNLDTLDMVSMQNYHSKAPCRFCAVHSFLPLGNEVYHVPVVKDLVGGAQDNAGFYDTRVTAVAGATDGSLSASNFQPCPADLPQYFKDAGAVGVKCSTVTISGEPCDLTPSSWEQSNLPVCSWDSNGRTLQPIEEGDEAGDSAERFLFVKKLSANQWVLLRNYERRHGPSVTEPGSFLRNHPAGWSLRMLCSAGVTSGYVWVNPAEDTHGTGILRDGGLQPAAHGEITPLGTVLIGFDGQVNLSGRFVWNRPIPDRVNTAADIRYFGGRTFGNVNVDGAEVYRNFIQTHPSWRQVRAPDGERSWYLDGNPFAPQVGGVLTLWNQSATQVSGSLYKLGPLQAPLVRKRLPTISWSGRNLVEDISGPGSVLGDGPADHWKYCVADFAGECVAGSQANDVYMNVPRMTLDGKCGNSFFFNRPCLTSMVNLGIGISQYGAARFSAFNGNDRFLTAQMQRYNATWSYDNAITLPDGSWAVTGGSWLDGARSDMLLFKIPPYPAADSINRHDFVPVEVSIGQRDGAPNVRVRFGYAENGLASSYYCTSRRDSCVASGSPYSWQSEAPSPVACSSGCTAKIPAIPGRVLYYVVERLDGAGSVVASDVHRAVAVP